MSGLFIGILVEECALVQFRTASFLFFHLAVYNLYFKYVIPITMKSILPSGPLKTKLIIINYNNHDKKAYVRTVVIIKDLKNDVKSEWE